MSNANLPDYLPKHDAECATRFVSEALRRGYTVSVYDGEETTVLRSRDPAAIFPAMGSTDSDAIVVRRPDRTLVGSFAFIWGNDPGDTIADYTLSPDLSIRAIAEELFDYALAPWVES